MDMGAHQGGAEGAIVPPCYLTGVWSQTCQTIVVYQSFYSSAFAGLGLTPRLVDRKKTANAWYLRIRAMGIRSKEGE